MEAQQMLWLPSHSSRRASTWSVHGPCEEAGRSTSLVTLRRPPRKEGLKQTRSTWTAMEGAQSTEAAVHRDLRLPAGSHGRRKPCRSRARTT
eukprot:6423028-Amphidinium_carterae.1